MKNLFRTIVGAGLMITLLIMTSPAQASSLPVGASQFILAGAGITSSQTTIQLTSLATPDGRLITMSNFGTLGYGAIDPQTTAKIEDISFTGITQNANGTATLTGVTRGLDFIYPYASTASLKHSHSGGATFIITNTAGFYYNEFTMNNNNNLFTWPTASSSPSSKGYVDYVAFNGAAVLNASETLKGVVQLSTNLQAASSTSTGSAGARLVIPGSIATSTYNAATAPLSVVVTQNNGKIDPNFIGTVSSTTIVGSTYAFDIGKHMQTFIASGTFTIPNGIRTVYARIVGSGGGGGVNTNSTCASGGGSGAYGETMIDVSATTTLTVNIGAAGVAGSDGATTTIASVISAAGGRSGAGAGALAGSPQAAVSDGGVGGNLVTGATASSTGQVGAGCFAAQQSNGTFRMTGTGAPSVLGSYGRGGDSATSGNTGAVIIYY